jgi:hypothetical protein
MILDDDDDVTDFPDTKCELTQAEVYAIQRYLLDKVAMCLDAERDCQKMDPLGGNLGIRDELREWRQRRATIELLINQLPMPIRKEAAKAKAKASTKAKASEIKTPQKRAKPTPAARKTLMRMLAKRPKG